MNKSIYLSVLVMLLAGFSSPVQASSLGGDTLSPLYSYDTGGALIDSSADGQFSADLNSGDVVAGGANEATASTTSKNVDSKAIAKYVSLVSAGAGGSTSGLLAAGTSIGGGRTPDTAVTVRKFTNLSTLGLSQDQITKNNQNQLKALLALISK
jgi:hypothetical protein